MCNEKISPAEYSDYRFLDYRLDQLEHNLIKGQEKLEKEYKENNKTVLLTLGEMQDGLKQQSESLVAFNQRLISIENKIKDIDSIKTNTTENSSKIEELQRRLEIYKQILFFVGTTAGGAIIIALFELITRRY